MKKRNRLSTAGFGLVILLATVFSATSAIAGKASSVELQQPAPETFPELFTVSDTCNVYVLRDGDAALLFNLGDATVLEHLPGIGVDQVAWVLFTDHHREKLQGVDHIDRSVTKVAAPEAERALFEEPRSFRKWYPSLNDEYTVHGASYVRPPRAPVSLDRMLEDGEVFTWRGFEIEVLATPGHSPGGVSYLFRKEGRTIAVTGGLMHAGARMTRWFDTEWDYKLSHERHGANFAIIISENGRGLVLDAGLFPESMLHEIIDGLKEHMGLEAIDAIWISHMHGDHFLLGPVLKETYGAEIWTLDRIVNKVENPRHYDYAALVAAYGDGFDGLEVDRAFYDGETIEWEGHTIQVDWMPGQTEFGCALWLELDGKRIVFTGDNIFANPEDEAQDGSEAVVARNSAIFEEGYLYASRYLKELEPDLIMGSHSDVMHDPAELIERYHAWSKRIIELYDELLPDENYEYLFDPYWVSAYPYRVDLSDGKPSNVRITVRNFRDTPQNHRIELKLPSGVTAEPDVLEGTVDPKSRDYFEVELTANPAALEPGVQIVPFDITLDDKHYGELFDFLIRGSHSGSPSPSLLVSGRRFP